MSDIASRVKAIIVDKLGVDENEVTIEASFTNDLGADSLDTVELIMEFEKEFNISIPDDQAENIATVGQAIAYLGERGVRLFVSLIATSQLAEDKPNELVRLSIIRARFLEQLGAELRRDRARCLCLVCFH